MDNKSVFKKILNSISNRGYFGTFLAINNWIILL